MTTKSWMRLTMGLGPEELELSAFLIRKNCYVFTCLYSTFTSINQSPPNSEKNCM